MFQSLLGYKWKLLNSYNPKLETLLQIYEKPNKLIETFCNGFFYQPEEQI